MIRKLLIYKAYKICRDLQTEPATQVLFALRTQFPHHSDTSLLELLIQVEKITSQDSVPIKPKEN